MTSTGIVRIIRNANCWLRAVILTLIFIPIQFIFDERLDILFSLIAGFAGIIMADRIFWYLAKKVPNKWGRENYLRMELAVTLTVSSIALTTGWIFYFL